MHREVILSIIEKAIENNEKDESFLKNLGMRVKITSNKELMILRNFFEDETIKLLVPFKDN